MGESQQVKIIENGKTASEDEIKGEMIKSRKKLMIEWPWKLYNKTFDSDTV